VPQIKQALGIGSVYTEISGWRYNPKKGEKGAQIDLLLDRRDHCINLCEIKFSTDQFVIDKKYAEEFEKKINVFKTQTKTKKSIFPTMITTYGVVKNSHYSSLIQAEVLMKDLFSR